MVSQYSLRTEDANAYELTEAVAHAEGIVS
jgi:hypothetical protein